MWCSAAENKVFWEIVVVEIIVVEIIEGQAKCAKDKKNGGSVWGLARQV